ncbi:pro-opiomelanocortin B-like [Hypomesus transpacificus]|uniref:pro-opiomelanocortin B-like n=1 Tax=Hypomesus transpacificus TaxID=137520 RepID=UPI001F086152|nr:pro-opiomelanocortin B-like [Hypomesus transpacificus]
MVCVSWLLTVTAVVFVCSPRVWAQCWDRPYCKDLSSLDKILECVHLCRSEVQTKSQEPSSAEQLSTEESFSLGILLAALASGEMALEPEPQLRSEERRSYSMEHFRWGKPGGRKRRPIKVFALEGGDSSEGFPLEARRQLNSVEDGGQGSRGRASPKAPSQLGLQAKKDTPYRMSHFRWGTPPAVKRHGSFVMPWEQSHEPLLSLLKNVIVNKEP